MTGTIFYDVVKALLLPPALGLILIAIGVFGLLRLSKKSRWRRLMRVLFVAGFSGLTLMSLIGVSDSLSLLIQGKSLEAANLQTIKAQIAAGNGPQVIVILGGGLASNGKEKPYGQRPSQRTVLRMMHGAYWHRQTALPILTSGGAPRNHTIAESHAMARSLAEDFQVQVTYLEDRSRDTLENALFSAKILEQAKMTRVLLVTSASHMRRSTLLFEAQGLQVTKAPVDFRGGADVATALAWIPSISGFETSFYVFHEIIALVQYRLLGKIPSF